MSSRATAIPAPKDSRSKSFSAVAVGGRSPQLVTPTSTPPNLHHNTSFAESRLQQLLMNCEAGTHSFHRGEGDDFDPSHHHHASAIAGPSGSAAAGDMRRKSFAAGEPIPGQKANRRPSFLSSLSLSRPFGFTPSQPTSPAVHPSRPAGLAMTSSSPSSMASSPVTEQSEMHRAKSTPPQPPQLQPLQTTEQPQQQQQTDPAGAVGMQRSRTAPNTPVKVAGFRSTAGTGSFSMSTVPQAQMQEEKRHFDPSREPRLLGLL